VLDELVLEPAAAAFLEVGTFVALALAAFGLLRWRLGDRLPAWLEAHRHRGPFAGAVLGAFPGCGGAIVVIPLYLKGQVSFGTVVATLTATMGDSSFVLLAADPALAVGVHAGLIVVGAATGLVVDRLGIAPRRRAAGPGAGGGELSGPGAGPPAPRRRGGDLPAPGGPSRGRGPRDRAPPGRCGAPSPRRPRAG
jgi:hypothetical protein